MGNFAENLNLGNRFRPPWIVISGVRAIVLEYNNLEMDGVVKNVVIFNQGSIILEIFCCRKRHIIQTAGNKNESL